MELDVVRESIDITSNDLAEFYRLKKDSRFALLELIALKWLRKRYDVNRIMANFYGFDYAIEVLSKRYALIECKIGRPKLDYTQWEGLAEMLRNGLKIFGIWIFLTDKARDESVYTLIEVLDTPIGEVYIHSFDYRAYLRKTKNFVVNALTNLAGL